MKTRVVVTTVILAVASTLYLADLAFSLLDQPSDTDWYGGIAILIGLGVVWSAIGPPVFRFFRERLSHATIYEQQSATPENQHNVPRESGDTGSGRDRRPNDDRV